MATTAKDVSQGKEQSRTSHSAPQNVHSPRARRAPKSFTADSSDKSTLAMPKEKSTPHYLKHTVSSAKDVCKYGKKQASDDTNLRYSTSRRKSMEPSPPPPTLKRALSSSSRGRTSTKPSAPLTKNGVSTKPGLDKTSKTPGGKAQPVLLTRPVSDKKGTSSTTTSKRETRAKTSNAHKTPSEPHIDERQVTKPEKEDNAVSVQEPEEEPDKSMAEEGIENEVLPTQDQLESESNNQEEEKSTDFDSSMLSKEQELIPNHPIEEQEVIGNEVPENDNKQEVDAQGEKNEETTTDNNDKGAIAGNDGSKPQDESEVEAKEEEETTNGSLRIQTAKLAPMDDGSDGHTPHKLNFKKGKELEKIEERDDGGQRLKFKERREETEGNVEAKPEQENVVLKRQDVQGKKESPAYNDVIEETASKLVEKRKSKVKALVGAFETVISLENENPQTEDT